MEQSLTKKLKAVVSFEEALKARESDKTQRVYLG
jgi:hypothetical protein